MGLSVSDGSVMQNDRCADCTDCINVKSEAFSNSVARDRFSVTIAGSCVMHVLGERRTFARAAFHFSWKGALRERVSFSCSFERSPFSTRVEAELEIDRTLLDIVREESGCALRERLRPTISFLFHFIVSNFNCF